MIDRLEQMEQRYAELQAQFAREGASTVEMSSAEFGKYIETEIDKWGRVIKEGHITAN